MAVGRFYQYIPNDYRSVFSPFPTKELGDVIAAKTELALKAWDYPDKLLQDIDQKVKAFSTPDKKAKDDFLNQTSEKTQAILDKFKSDPAAAIFELRALGSSINKDINTGKMSNINKNAPFFDQNLKIAENYRTYYAQKNGDRNVLEKQISQMYNHDSNSNNTYTPFLPTGFANPVDIPEEAIKYVQGLPEHMQEGSATKVNLDGDKYTFMSRKTSDGRIYDKYGKDITTFAVKQYLLSKPEVREAINVLGVDANEYISPAATSAALYAKHGYNKEYIGGIQSKTEDAIKRSNLNPPSDSGQGYIEYLNKGDVNTEPTLKKFLGGKFFNGSLLSTDKWDANGDFTAETDFSQPFDATFNDLRSSTKKERIQYAKEFNDKLKEIYSNTPLLQQRLNGKYNGKQVYEFVYNAVNLTKNPFNLEYTISNVDSKDLNKQILGNNTDNYDDLSSLAGKTIVPLSGENMYKSQIANISGKEGKIVSILPEIEYTDAKGDSHNVQGVPVMQIKEEGKFAIIDTKLNYIGKSNTIQQFTEAKKDLGVAKLDKNNNSGFTSYISTDASNNPVIDVVKIDKVDISGNENLFTNVKPVGTSFVVRNGNTDLKYDVATAEVITYDENNQPVIDPNTNNYVMKQIYVGVNKNDTKNIYLIDDTTNSMLSEMKFITRNLKREK